MVPSANGAILRWDLSIADCRLPFEQARGLRFAMDIERTGQIKKVECFRYQTAEKWKER